MESKESNISRGRVPPQDIDAERSVLGAMLLEPEAVLKVVDSLKSVDFYRNAHVDIYQSMLDLHKKNEPIDEITVSNILKINGKFSSVGGVTFFTSILDTVPSAANVVHYASIVKNHALRRRLINITTSITGSSYEGNTSVDALLDQAEEQIFNINRMRETTMFSPIKDVIKDAFETIQKRFEKKKSITGVSSGFIDLDKMTAGFQPSDLIILAGRPSMGKTTLALNMIQNVATKDNVPVAVFSLEMSKEQLVMRMLSSTARVDSSKLRGGFLDRGDFPKLAKAAGILSQAPIFIDDSGSLNAMELRTKARRLKAEHQIGLIVIDYLQLMSGRTYSDNREREISEISRGLKALAKELNIPIIALSQLNRSLESRADKRPMLSDLRESGAIEQDADVISFIYRDEYYNPETTDAKGEAELIIGKQRNGPTGITRLKFFNQFTLFENIVHDK